ncbi:MAG: hypothetical protein V1886_01730 [archaeon]
MRLDNNKIALIIVMFALLSLAGNLFVWMKITGNLTVGKASLGRVGVCIDRPPTLGSITDKTAIAGSNFTHQVIATDSGNPIYYYGRTSQAAGKANLTSFFISRTSGLINFTPLENETGTYTVLIWATHGLCGNISNSSTTFSLEIFPPNRVPYWINYTRNFNLTEDILFTVNLSSFVVEPNNESINFTHNSTSAIFPSFDFNIYGLINFSANDSDVGFHSMNITVRDERNAANSSGFNFTVLNVNDAPLLGIIPDMQTCEDANFLYQAAATDEDLLIPVRYRTESLHFYDNTALFVINENTGQIDFTPNSLQANVYSIRVYVSDEEASDFKDFALNIISTNDAPVMQHIGAKTVYINSSLNYTAYASDEEDGDTPGALRFNSTFTSGTTFFTINAATGNINFSANATINGTYAVRICVTDLGFTAPANISFCNQTAAPKNACENVSFTITLENHAPNITSYYPENRIQSITEGESITFNATAEDEDGTTPSILWYKNDIFILANSTYTFSTSSGAAGAYNVTALATDGLLNDTVVWNVTVNSAPIVSTAVSGGGGGGGGGCTEQWICTDWSLCQNASTPDSIAILGNIYETVISNCSSLLSGECGFQTRSCFDKANCRSTSKQPKEMQVCAFTLLPDCYDSILNCHDGMCEVLPDCGGPCKPCTTCSDGIQNQGEDWIDCGGPCKACALGYPRAPKCGDEKCELAEIFSCRHDCGLFQFILAITLILAALAVAITRKEMQLLKSKEEEKDIKRKRALLNSFIERTKKAISEKDITLARHYYTQTRSLYDALPQREKRKYYNRIMKLYSGIGRLRE